VKGDDGLDTDWICAECDLSN